MSLWCGTYARWLIVLNNTIRMYEWFNLCVFKTRVSISCYAIYLTIVLDCKMIDPAKLILVQYFTSRNLFLLCLKINYYTWAYTPLQHAQSLFYFNTILMNEHVERVLAGSIRNQELVTTQPPLFRCVEFSEDSIVWSIKCIHSLYFRWLVYLLILFDVQVWYRF